MLHSVSRQFRTEKKKNLTDVIHIPVNVLDDKATLDGDAEVH